MFGDALEGGTAVQINRPEHIEPQVGFHMCLN